MNVLYNNSTKKLPNVPITTVINWLKEVSEKMYYSKHLSENKTKTINNYIYSCAIEIFYDVLEQLDYKVNINVFQAFGIACLVVAYKVIAQYDLGINNIVSVLSSYCDGACPTKLVVQIEKYILNKTNWVGCPGILNNLPIFDGDTKAYNLNSNLKTAKKPPCIKPSIQRMLNRIKNKKIVKKSRIKALKQKSRHKKQWSFSRRKRSRRSGKRSVRKSRRRRSRRSGKRSVCKSRRRRSRRSGKRSVCKSRR
jgi:hypothetical protein